MSDNWELKPWQGIPQVSDAATVCRSELSVVDREEYDTEILPEKTFEIKETYILKNYFDNQMQYLQIRNRFFRKIKTI